MTELENNKYHYLFALLLGVAGLLIILIFVTIRSQADTQNSESTVTISNAAPSIDTVVIATSSTSSVSNIAAIEWTEATGQTVYVNGTFSDANGCYEVQNNYSNGGDITAWLYHSGTSSDAVARVGSNNYNSRYTGDVTSTANCAIYECGSTTDQAGSFSCSFNVKYWADPTDASSPYPNDDWTAYVLATDGTDTGYRSSTTENNSLAAVSFVTSTWNDYSGGPTLNFGALALGGNTGSANGGTHSLDITNTGNIQTDISVSGTAMQCSVGGVNNGTIPVGNLVYAQNASTTAYSTSSASWYVLSGTPSTSLNFNLAKISLASGTFNTSTDRMTTTTYWGLGIPTNGVSGSCTSTATIASVAQTY